MSFRSKIYLVKDKNYCIYDCKMETMNKYLYNGNCLKSCPEYTTIENYLCKDNPNKAILATNQIHISEEDDNNYLKVVKTMAIYM